MRVAYAGESWLWPCECEKHMLLSTTVRPDQNMMNRDELVIIHGATAVSINHTENAVNSIFSYM